VANKRDIHKRIYIWVLLVLRFTKTISQTLENQTIIKQLIKAATSVGANDQEADGAESKHDFIHKYSISKKEAKESVYWLSILKDLKCGNLKLCKEAINEGKEIIKIISSIIINSKNNKS